MDEQEFDALKQWRPFGTGDAMRSFARQHADTALVMKLGSALWGATPEDLRRQLRAPHPEIPSGFDVADFRKLLECTARLHSAFLKLQQLRGLPPTPGFYGTSGLNFWAARFEIVRRALDYLEKR